MTRTDQKDKAIPYYEFILDKDKNQFTEKSLVSVAYFYLDQENWEKAVEILSRLENEAETEQNILFAQSNLMKGNYALKNFDVAVDYAEKVMENQKLEPKINFRCTDYYRQIGLCYRRSFEGSGCV